MASLTDVLLAPFMRRTADPTDKSFPGAVEAVEDFGSNPGSLTMLAYAPATLRPGAPMVVVLHGCGQDAQANARASGWMHLADRHGFSVVMPVQSSSNNPARCFSWFQARDVSREGGEAESIAQMTAAGLARYAGNPQRVFVVGLSAGGAMAAAMLAAYPEMFAAGGVIAGLPHGAAEGLGEAFSAMSRGRDRTPAAWGDLVRQASSHAGPWPRLSIWQGASDTTVNPANAEALALQWADVQGLPVGPTRTKVAGGHRRDCWLSPSGEVMIELNMVKGLGHGTPIAAGQEGAQSGSFILDAGISSSLELLRFWGVAPAAAAPASAPVIPVVGGVLSKALSAANRRK